MYIWGHKELDMTEPLSSYIYIHTHTHTHIYIYIYIYIDRTKTNDSKICIKL